MGITRRNIIGASIAGAFGAAGAVLGQEKTKRPGNHLRPPGALQEKEFKSSCARCFRCGDACPNGCIDFYALKDGLDKAFTPYIHARTRGCTLCGECSKACPTGAIGSYEVSRDGWKKDVNMGLARVNESLCYSFHGRTCGACYRACPLAGEAMKIGVFETPIVQADVCVGCGLCEQACLHLPQAIRVVPREQVAQRDAVSRKKRLPILSDDGHGYRRPSPTNLRKEIPNKEAR